MPILFPICLCQREGGQVANSCNLSAACVILKDLDENTRIKHFQIKTTSLLDLVRNTKLLRETADSDEIKLLLSQKRRE
jgi:hypothetical protein